MTNRSEFAANQALTHKPFKFAPANPAPVKPETVSVFNLVSDNPLVNGATLAAASVASVLTIADSVFRFFA